MRPSRIRSIRVMFLNSGSEAIDGALKLARRVTGRPGIVAFRGGFHGRTFGATSITTSNLNYRTGYEPLLPGVYFAPFPAAYRDFDGDEEAASEASLAILHSLFATIISASQVAAIVIEPVQGARAATSRPRPRSSAASGPSAIATEFLLVVDEVQTGFGRTGEMWAFEHSGIVPDVVCMAKAIANGLPLSAIISSRELQERWGAGRMVRPTAATRSPVPPAWPCSKRSATRTWVANAGVPRGGARRRPRQDRRRGRPDRRHPGPRPDGRRRVRHRPGDPRAGLDPARPADGMPARTPVCWC